MFTEDIADNTTQPDENEEWGQAKVAGDPCMISQSPGTPGNVSGIPFVSDGREEITELSGVWLYSHVTGTCVGIRES